MSLLKYLERLKRMDDLIRRKATGNGEEFARKLGISRSQLFEDLKELRELGAEIEYCAVKRSYFSKDEQCLAPSFLTESYKIRGGICHYYSEISSTILNNQDYFL